MKNTNLSIITILICFLFEFSFSQDFGDLTVAKQEMNAGLSDNVRGVFGGGQVPSAPIRLNSIDYVTIASTGNAQDFGDLTGERNSSGSASDSHGGIS